MSLALRTFSGCKEQRLDFLAVLQASHCGGFSCWGAQALDAAASVVVATWGLVVQGLVGSSQTWDLSKPVSPELADRFLSSVPPGRSAV